MFSKATRLLLFIILSGFCLNQGEVLIARELVGMAWTQKSRIQNCTNQGPTPKACERPKSSQHSVGFISCSVHWNMGRWAKSFLLIGEQVTYQNEDLLVSRAVSASSRRFTNDSVGWGTWRRKVSGNPVCKAGYNFVWLLLPLGSSGQLTLHYWSASFLCPTLCLFSPQPPRNQTYENQMHRCSCFA